MDTRYDSADVFTFLGSIQFLKDTILFAAQNVIAKEEKRAV